MNTSPGSTLIEAWAGRAEFPTEENRERPLKPPPPKDHSNNFDHRELAKGTAPQRYP